MKVVNKQLEKTFELNANYTAYQVETKARIVDVFDLVDKPTIERIMKQRPDLFPQPSVNIPIDQLWNRKQLNSSILQGILNGESIPKIAKRLSEVAIKDYKVAVRNARTATTGAENGGRVYSYERAEEMGIELEQEWLATLDGRTRHSHRQLDGEKIKVGGTFSNGCKFPGDPDGAPSEVQNCRCTLVAALKGIDNSHNERLTSMMTSYEDWKAGKKVNYYPSGWEVDINKRDRR